ncbi:hypothetical protein B0T17DRAFT_235126 [Bombardia bombarda]|uniref:Uncharacterized protein n=1 Tax=Bombardia bombarda TaxID=252184 RepID=A0AA39XBZ9_9PEZI|nr:hypothetical protein B0T17DRAFT_235126 [Bombardia bombarda]
MFWACSVCQLMKPLGCFPIDNDSMQIGPSSTTTCTDCIFNSLCVEPDFDLDWECTQPADDLWMCFHCQQLKHPSLFPAEDPFYAMTATSSQQLPPSSSSATTTTTTVCIDCTFDDLLAHDHPDNGLENMPVLGLEPPITQWPDQNTEEEEHNYDDHHDANTATMAWTSRLVPLPPGKCSSCRKRWARAGMKTCDDCGTRFRATRLDRAAKGQCITCKALLDEDSRTRGTLSCKACRVKNAGKKAARKAMMGGKGE